MSLVRIETRHGHRYELDGQPCPGVTTLIGGGIPKPALMHWSARTVAEHIYNLSDDAVLEMKHRSPEHTVNAWKKVPFQQRDQAAVRGTEVHGYAERLIKGWHVDVPVHLAGYVQACVDFMNEWRPAPVLVEAVVGSRRHGYCGTVDLICDLPDGRRALMDYKTAKSGIWPETALQLAAYRHAEFALSTLGLYEEIPMADIRVDCAYAIWLRDGSYEVRPLQTGPDVFDVFLAASTTANATKLMKSWVGPAETWSAHQ